ncbi:uncharacterized protein RHIMIDRAFT_269400 [Rhizopus microsporus ATCC 52813]|uniref:Uncharacterized protein n=1 Tax=Rhizopus microsporus ATCC 52813 TaxID=1340429 RepID=A0A2G4SHK3_RHIZD|nr:uncharacterized protein RHIMIDRAFT_269400 [Rhizopus microsporus ATCC 52813]PHZ08250.1 hypothetical protein RHIMIDRAFT_269400 [Rhizopus microsporus ATCC 52813]
MLFNGLDNLRGPNRKQDAAFVSLIRTDDFTADVVIVNSVKTGTDEHIYYSEQNIGCSLLDNVMASEGLKGLSLCTINKYFMLPMVKIKALIKLGDAPQKNIIPIPALRGMKKREREGMSNESIKDAFLNISTAKIVHTLKYISKASSTGMS